MAPLARQGFRVDGTDVSDRMLSFARAKPVLAQSTFHLSNGNDCGNAPPELVRHRLLVTNSETDVWVTPGSDSGAVMEDLGRWFSDIRLQFVELPREARLFTEAYGTWFEHLIVSGTKGLSLAQRIYSQVD